MSRAKVHVSVAARRDLDRIAGYLEEQAGRRTARRWVLMVEAQTVRLAEHPLMGQSDANLGEGLRRTVVAPYVIVYEVSPDCKSVSVLRILHGARDIPSLLGVISSD